MRKRFSGPQIVAKLRQADKLFSQMESVIIGFGSGAEGMTEICEAGMILRKKYDMFMLTR
jgi:hypothetical protein